MRFSHPAAAHKEGHRPILELIAKRGNIYDLQTPHILHVTRDLLELCDWLASNEVTHVAMEARSVLETGMEHPRSKLHHSFGERPARESGPRTKNRCEGLPMDCRLVTARIIERQLYTTQSNS